MLVWVPLSLLHLPWLRISSFVDVRFMVHNKNPDNSNNNNINMHTLFVH